MVPYDRKILNALLDSYENSLLSIGENKRTVHVDFVFTKKSIPEYFDESSAEYESIHILMKGLEDKGFVEILWKNGRKDHQIERIRLNDDRVGDIYAILGRRPKGEREKELILLLEEFMENLPEESCRRGMDEQFGMTDALVRDTVSYRFADYLRTRLCLHQTVKEYIDLVEPRDALRLLQAVRCVEWNEKDCYVREFSVRNFKDSKFFESIEHKVAGIFSRFRIPAKEEGGRLGSAVEPEGLRDTTVETEEILSEYGIYHTPNYVYLKGNVRLCVGAEILDLSLLSQGIGLSGEDLSLVGFSSLLGIRRVLTIENQTTFFRWKEEGCLIIYLGGYHNSVRRRLLQKIHRLLPSAEYFHFGDIDAGGFAILTDLRRKTGIPFQAYQMDVDVLRRYEAFGKRLTANDRKRLEKMLSAGTPWRDTIQYMLSHDVKLEQEGIC